MELNFLCCLVIQLELIPSSIMVREDGGSGRSEVVVMVSSSGLTERPVTVFFITSDGTATGNGEFLKI